LTKSIRSRLIPFFCVLTLLSTLAPATVQLAQAAPPDAQAKRSPLLAALQAELEAGDTSDPLYAESLCTAMVVRLIDGAERVDAIVLDLVLPKVDGISLIPMLRRSTEAPILMLSAQSDVSSVVAGLEAGADDYIAKPFDFTELCARLRSATSVLEISVRSCGVVVGLGLSGTEATLG